MWGRGVPGRDFWGSTEGGKDLGGIGGPKGGIWGDPWGGPQEGFGGPWQGQIPAEGSDSGQGHVAGFEVRPPVWGDPFWFLGGPPHGLGVH